MSATRLRYPNDPLISGRGDFFDRVGHVLGGEELAFFDVDRQACFATGVEEVGLVRIVEVLDALDEHDEAGCNGTLSAPCTAMP